MVFREIVFCFVLLLVTDYIKEVSSLTEGGEGVCVGKISSKKTRKVFYTKYSNKWCGKKKCTVKVAKTQPYVVTSNVTVCCNGYQYQSQENVCVPLCSTGCLGGRCVAPEKCECDPPAILNKNTCETPHCDRCFNADCATNNTCICKESYQPFNTTHCYKCDPGYEIDVNFTCIPKCDSCENGTCTAPNNCTCNPGYENVDSKCVPKCEGCVNAICVSPNTCVCNEGFSVVNYTYCEPICEDCNDGVCISPGVCNCSEGYSKVNGTCEPICDNSCVNGVCSGPNVCTCYDGYNNNETSPNICYNPEDNCNGACNLGGEGVCETIVK